MCDEVPVAPAAYLRAERNLGQRAVAIHIKDTQAGVVSEELEDSARISAGVVLKSDDRPVLGEGCQPTLQDCELCAFHVHLDQRRHVVRRQDTVENLDLDFKFLDRLDAVSEYLETTARVSFDNAEESTSAGRGRHGRFSYLHLREGLAQTRGAVRKRFECDMAAIRGVTNHVSEEMPSTRANVDTIRIGRQRQRKKDTQGVVVPHRPPDLARADGALHGTQLWLQPYCLGDPQHLTANGDHDFQRIADVVPR